MHCTPVNLESDRDVRPQAQTATGPSYYDEFYGQMSNNKWRAKRDPRKLVQAEVASGAQKHDASSFGCKRECKKTDDV